MMNPEIKVRWLEALCSGKYKQTTHHLRDDTGMCCLGVLCDIVDPDAWKQDREGAFSYKGEVMLPPRSICQKAGIPLPDYLDGDGITARLARRNDSGDTFLEIADIIEQDL